MARPQRKEEEEPRSCRSNLRLLRRTSALAINHPEPVIPLPPRFGHSRGWLWRSLRVEPGPETSDSAKRRAGGLNCQSRTHRRRTRNASLASRQSDSRLAIQHPPHPRARSVLGVRSPSIDGRPVGRPMAAPAARVARSRASLDPCAAHALGFHALRCGKRPCGPASLSKRPRMRFAASARRWRREAGEAQRSSREAA